MKKKNVLMTALSLTLVGVIAAGSTLAYLTSQSDTLTNTFTVGEGYGTDGDGFYLDETTAKTEVVDGALVITNPTEKDEFGLERTTEGNGYAAMSIGDTIYKDPTFHLDEGPESYIFAKVEGVDAMEADGVGFDFTGWSTNWVKVDGSEDRDGYYRYTSTVTAGTEIAPLFTKVSLPAALQALPDASHLTNITIKGVAIQAANLATWENAWAALAEDAPDFYPAA